MLEKEILRQFWLHWIVKAVERGDDIYMMMVGYHSFDFRRWGLTFSFLLCLAPISYSGSQCS
jgi:hypothetical protein